MKKNLNLLIAIIGLVAIFFSSCSVTKRYHNKGFHIDWSLNKKAKIDKEKSTPIEVTNCETDIVTIDNSDVITQNQEEEIIAIGNVEKEEIKSTIAILRQSKPIKAFKEAKKIKTQLNLMESENVNVSEIKSSNKKSTLEYVKNKLASSDNTLLLVILALLLPPLAVYLYEGSWTGRCTLNLILTLLCGLPGVIHALIIILGNK